MLVNTGLNGVGTHLKGPMTVLLVLVGHSEGARWAGRESGGGGADGGGGGDERAVVTGDNREWHGLG